MVNYNTCFSYIVDELQKKKCEEKIIRAKLLPQEKKDSCRQVGLKKNFRAPKMPPPPRLFLMVRPLAKTLQM